MSYDSSTVAAGDDALASDYNDLRRDVVENAGDYASSTGSANAYVLAVDSQIVSAYSEKQVFKFKANFANTGSATLNVNTIGAITIKKSGGLNLVAGDIASGQIIVVIYDGTDFQMQTTGMDQYAANGDTPFFNAGPKVLSIGSAGQTKRARSGLPEWISTILDTITSATATSGTTETTMMTATLPGGTLDIAGVVAFKAFGTIVLDSTGHILRFNLKYGSTTVATFDYSTTGTQAPGTIKVSLEGLLLGAGGTSAQTASLYLDGGKGGQASVIQSGDYEVGFGGGNNTATEDSTGDLTISLTVQSVTNAATSFTAETGYIQVL